MFCGMSLRCLLGFHRASLAAITRRHDAHLLHGNGSLPSWQPTPLALSLAGCDTGAAQPMSQPATQVSAGARFDCTPIRVYDGDGPIWCAEGPRVRLTGIAAQEMDGTCRPNQPCPAVSAEASEDLAALVGCPTGRREQGHTLMEGATSCVSTDSAGGRRTGAWCTSLAVGFLASGWCGMVMHRSARNTGRSIAVAWSHQAALQSPLPSNRLICVPVA